MAAKNPSLYRAIYGLRHGQLHRALHVPENENISEAKLNAGSHSENAHIAHMSNFAKTLKGINDE